MCDFCVGKDESCYVIVLKIIKQKNLLKIGEKEMNFLNCLSYFLNK